MVAEKGSRLPYDPEKDKAVMENKWINYAILLLGWLVHAEGYVIQLRMWAFFTFLHFVDQKSVFVTVTYLLPVNRRKH